MLLTDNLVCQMQTRREINGRDLWLTARLSAGFDGVEGGRDGEIIGIKHGF